MSALGQQTDAIRYSIRHAVTQRRWPDQIGRADLSSFRGYLRWYSAS